MMVQISRFLFFLIGLLINTTYGSTFIISGNRTSTDSGISNITVDGNDVTVASKHMEAKILGHSGKIRLRSTTNDTDACTIGMDSIKEYNADGDAVSNHGQERHSFNTFASQSFAFSNITSVKVGNVSADAFSFYSVLDNDATLNVTAYFILEDGFVSINDANYELAMNDFKFDIDISNWDFCSSPSSCGTSNLDGGSLEFELEIKGKGGAAPLRKTSKKNRDGSNQVPRNKTDFDLGSDILLVAPTSYELNGDFYSMPDGYPSVTTQGSKTIFTFKFPKFNGTLKYDPTVNGISTSVTTDMPTSETAAPTNTASPSATVTDTPTGSDAPTDATTDAPTSSDAPTDATTDAPTSSDAPTDETTYTPTEANTNTDAPTTDISGGSSTTNGPTNAKDGNGDTINSANLNKIPYTLLTLAMARFIMK